MNLQPVPRKNQKQIRLYISDDSDDTVQRLRRLAPSLTDTDIVNLILEAGLRSVAEAGYRLPLGFSFEIVEPTASELKNRLSLNDKK